MSGRYERSRTGAPRPMHRRRHHGTPDDATPGPRDASVPRHRRSPTDHLRGIGTRRGPWRRRELTGGRAIEGDARPPAPVPGSGLEVFGGDVLQELPELLDLLVLVAGD